MEMLMTPRVLESAVVVEEQVVEEVVELVIPPTENTASLFKFMSQLSNELECKSNSFQYAEILHTHGGWKRGVVITMSVWCASFTQFLDGLKNFAKIQEVEEKPLINLAFLGIPRKPEMLPSSNVSPSKRIHLALVKN